MTDYAIVQFLAWLAVGAVLFLFVATGGFDLGAGFLLPFVSRTDAERRTVINSVGPTWDGNQVWLIIIVAGMFAIWPRAYAASFSGFYIAILLVLWSLFLRPVSFEYRSKLQSLKWRKFWDCMLFLGSFIPALLFGVALGNLLLGVPFHYAPLSLRFFYTGSFFGLLRPFALFVGVAGLCMLAMHGAAYLAMRTEGVVYQRVKKAFKIFASLFVILFLIGAVLLNFVPGYHLEGMHANPAAHPLVNVVTSTTGGWYANYLAHPEMFLAPVLAVIGVLLAIRFNGKDQNGKAFLASLLTLLMTLLTYGLATFPFVMPSISNPSESLLVWNASSSELSLIGILIVALIMLPIIFAYTAFVYRKMWGRNKRISVERVEAEDHQLY
jgi:cytochrome d ubiquinol oxidase subunit II